MLGVVGAAGDAAVGVGDLGAAPALVVAVGGDPAVGVGGGDELPGGVVGEPAAPAAGVAGLDDAARRVVAVRRGAHPGHAHRDDPAVGLEAGGRDLTGRQVLLDDPAVGVVDPARRGAGLVGDRRQPAAGVVGVGHLGAGGLDHRDDAAGGVADHAGQAAGRVDDLDRPAAAVVAGQPDRPVRSGLGDQATELVEVEACGALAGGAVEDLERGGGSAARLGELPAYAGRVDDGGGRAEDVVLLVQRPALGVGDRGDPAQRVVRELPARPVREHGGGDPPQVVVGAADRATQRVDRRGLLAVRAVLQLGPAPGGVGDGDEAARGAALVAPGRAVGADPLGEHAAGRVVGVRRALPARGDRGADPAGRVALEPRHVALGVGRGLELPVLVVGEVRGDPGGVAHLPEEPACPDQAGDAALGIGDGARAALVALVGQRGHGDLVVAVPRHEVAAVDHRVPAGDLDAGDPVELVVGVDHVGAARGHLSHAPATRVVLGDDDRAVALGDEDLVVVGVVGHGLAPAMGVDDTDEATSVVGDPGVGAGAVLVGDDGDAAREVGEARDATERRALTDDASALVVGVGGLDHAVGVGHGGDQPGLVPAVAAGPERPGGGDQTAVLVVEGDRAAVGGTHGDDAGLGPGAGPREVDRAAALVGQADQPVPVPGQADRGALADRDAEQPAGAGVDPTGAVVARDDEPLVALRRGPLTGQPQVGAGGAVPAGAEAGEGDPAAVGQREGGRLVAQDEPGVAPAAPAGSERADVVVHGVVRAPPRQRGAGRGELEVDLGLGEVAGRGVDRVVGVPRGRGSPERGGHRDVEVGAGGGDVGRAQGGGESGVGQRRDRALAPGCGEGVADGVGPPDVVVVGLRPPVQTGEDAVGAQRAPPAAGLEGGVERAESPGLPGQLTVGAGGAGGEEVQVARAGRRRAGAPAASRARRGRLALAAGRARRCEGQPRLRLGDGAVVAVPEGVVEPAADAAVVVLGLPGARVVAAPLLGLGVRGQGGHGGRGGLQRGDDLTGVEVGGLGVGGEQLGEVAAEVGQRRAGPGASGPLLAADRLGDRRARRPQRRGVGEVELDVRLDAVHRVTHDVSPRTARREPCHVEPRA